MPPVALNAFRPYGASALPKVLAPGVVRTWINVGFANVGSKTKPGILLVVDVENACPIDHHGNLKFT